MQPAARDSVSVGEFRANLARYLKRAEEGAHIAVVSRDRVVAELHPPSAPAQEAPAFGCMRGQIWMAPDWDDPDHELIDIMLNGPIFPEPAP